MSQHKGHNTQDIFTLAAVLTFTLTVMKLVGAIQWSWWWVFSPLWITATVGALVLIALIIFALWGGHKIGP